jgi:hypothetical protein
MAPHPRSGNGSALAVIRPPSETGPTIQDLRFLVSKASNLLLTLPHLDTSLRRAHFSLSISFALIQWCLWTFTMSVRLLRTSCHFCNALLVTTRSLPISKLQSISWSLWMVVCIHICGCRFHITTRDAMPPVVINKRHCSLHTLVCFDRWVLHCICVACVYHT